MKEVSSFLTKLARFNATRLPLGRGAVNRTLGPFLLSPESRYMRTRHGSRLVLSPDSFEVFGVMAANGAAWDYDDFDVCFAATCDGGVYYDVGANIGYFAAEMVERSGRRVQAIAFEAQEPLANAIEATSRVNGYGDCLKVVCALVGDQTGHAKMFLSSASFLASPVEVANRRRGRTIDRPMLTIDSLVDAGALPMPTMVKMDIEGSEFMALRGARSTLRTSRPHLFVEYDKDDPDLRTWNELQSLADDTGCYDFYFSPRKSYRAQYPSRLVSLGDRAELARADAIFMRNRQKDLRDSSILPD